jgi:hypothetical protein
MKIMKKICCLLSESLIKDIIRFNLMIFLPVSIIIDISIGHDGSITT